MAESVIHLAEQHITSVIKQRSTTKQCSKALNSIKLQVDGLLSDLKAVDKLYAGAQGGNGLDKVRNRVEELKRIAYEVEDAVDLLVYNLSPSFYLCFGVNRVSKKLRKLKEQLKEMKGKLDQNAQGSEKPTEQIKEMKGKLDQNASEGSEKPTDQIKEMEGKLDQNASEGSDKPTLGARGSQDHKDHLHEKDDVVIDFHHEITNTVDRLTGKFKSKDSLQPLNRLAIVGMGGSGKTTLARSIYNHKAIKKRFHFQAWVSVTQGWDTTVVLRSILKQVQEKRRWFSELPNNEKESREGPDELASQMNNRMLKKTCLIVLDDVWDMKSLCEFIALIQTDDIDSCKYTIVITSRQSPLKDANWFIHQPQLLTDEESGELLSLVASKSKKALTNDYYALAKEMLRKCEGLPLPIVALGRLLKTLETKSEWQTVLAQITGKDATLMYGPVSETLGLSYDELPYYLKPCFLYLGLFPGGSPISGGQLIRMWIAEGFIKSKDNEGETLEKAGRRCLQELVDHAAVIVVSETYSGKVKSIRLHDIMRDFCLLKAKEMDLATVSSSKADAIVKTSRRAAIDLSEGVSLPRNNFHLRSLAILGKSTSEAPERYPSQVNQRHLDLEQVCQMYKWLRVLDIVGIKSPDGTLPKEIGNLIQLTYLRIRATNIRQLPKSIGKLRNLLTLDYRDVSVDKEMNVPNVLWKLKKLRHLYLPNEMRGMVKELRLHKLKDLITLWGVGGGQWMPDEMNRLSSTLSKLYIHRISTQLQLNAVISSPSMKNGCLYALALDWYGFESKNLDELLAKQSLTKLRLMGKAPDNAQGLAFPSKLGKLELYYTQIGEVATMEHLGTLAFLKVLKLLKDSYIGSEWSCGEESFPVLEDLKLANLPNLKNWEMEKGAMPCLKKLSIVSCMKLEGMPKGLKHVQSLEELDIERMSYNFRNRLHEVKGSKKGGGEDADIIKHITHVTIRDSSGQSF